MTQHLKPVKMITIIALDALADRLISDLKSCGIRGYTLAEVAGEGLHVRHFSGWEGRNIRIDTLTNELKAAKLMELLSDQYFEKYGIVAFVQTVEVLRPEKYS
jgi:nitrogen regulatory protein P-II 2